MIEAFPSPLTPETTRLFTKKTRDRILEASLILFNERGFGSVTTASIAQQAGILEGSLWYHFNTKKDILLAHIELLQRIFLEKNQTKNSNKPAVVIEGVFESYNVIWDFRYILRDDFTPHLTAENDVLQKTQSINDFLDQWTLERIQHSDAIGLLHIPPSEMEAVSEITLVIGRYWLDFSRKKFPDQPEATTRKRGLSHVFTVLRPYLSSEGQGIIDRLLSNL